MFRPRALIGEYLRQALDGGFDQLVGLLNRMPRLVDEAALNIVPACPEVLRLVG